MSPLRQQQQQQQQRPRSSTATSRPWSSPSQPKQADHAAQGRELKDLNPKSLLLISSLLNFPRISQIELNLTNLKTNTKTLKH
jgi:hypothetical protein